MVVVSISFRAQPHKRAEILSAIDDLVERMRVSPGCGRARLYTDSEDANAHTIVSEWQSSADADSFLSSRDFQLFRGVRFLLRSEPVIVVDEIQTRVTRLAG